MNEPRETTFEERATWGVCPVCAAEPGQSCYAEIGFHFGAKGNGERMKTGEGAHLARLQRAPRRVQLVAVS